MCFEDKVNKRHTIKVDKMCLQVDKERMIQRLLFNNLRIINHEFEAAGIFFSTLPQNTKGKGRKLQ